MKTDYKKLKEELTYLRDNSTEREKSRLNLKTFNARSGYECIYGQLYVGFYSKKACKIRRIFAEVDSTPLEFYIWDKDKKLLTTFSGI